MSRSGVNAPDRYHAADRASDAIAASTGRDVGDELRRQAELLAYAAAQEYELTLRRIETALVVAANQQGGLTEAVQTVALDIVRTHLVRGLLRAQREAGEHMTFWVHP